MTTLTKEQAQLLWQSFNLSATLRSEEEMDLLQSQNPELLEAYYALHRIGFGASDDCKTEDTVTEAGWDAHGDTH